LKKKRLQTLAKVVANANEVEELDISIKKKLSMFELYRVPITPMVIRSFAQDISKAASLFPNRKLNVYETYNGKDMFSFRFHYQNAEDHFGRLLDKQYDDQF